MVTDDDIQPLLGDAIRVGLLEAVGSSAEEQRRWCDCDLASLAENRCGERVDPFTLDDVTRKTLEGAALEEPLWMPVRRARYTWCGWLREGGERVGTIALGTSMFGGSSTRVSSFYVLPAHRGRGAGGRAFARLQAVFAAHERGLRLETCWTWQRTVRWYLRAGLWVRMWKDDLQLCWSPGDPVPRFEIGDSHAKLFVEIEGERIVMCEAERDGERLVACDESPKFRTAESRDPRLERVHWHSLPTFALGLALAGWPLVRSREQWDACFWADSGPPEALAHKIEIWEAWSRKHGWRVETPRIPGLAYPTWAELEARWARSEPLA